MALDGVLSTGSLYAQVPNGNLTAAYASSDTATETAGNAASGGTSAGATRAGGTGSSEDAASRFSAPAYISPVVNYDSQAAIAVTEFRDSVTGAVDYQIPSRQVVEQYRLRAAGSPRYQGGTTLLPAEVTAPSRDQPTAGGAPDRTASTGSGTAGTAAGGTDAGSGTSTAGTGASGGSGGAVISPTVAAITLGAAAASVNVVA
ncbi:hypothetical protein [Nitrospirillum iridis]|uniref:Uncharacterized protein n=1 Tax=Nitrospirillum iridis TaxID=765888 RepID=A0A7X0B021_9PROT|nr:hypothetical protein [Nitrospirillum iridis]MBB6252190.1 hypothetical protein [Nitrospirillum iridis]